MSMCWSRTRLNHFWSNGLSGRRKYNNADPHVRLQTLDELHEQLRQSLIMSSVLMLFRVQSSRLHVRWRTTIF
jgi:hypothetical protein